MEIKYAKKFEKRFKKLSPKMKKSVIDVVERFTKNPHDKVLCNHPLKGSLEGRRAMSVTGDMRIVFREYDDYVLVLMLDVGIHNQVYS
ncbi:type II toxin-antitoxin system mRNA interferase toxin, RelE/StbE family [Patescibacteria group bacterium]|nr:type II toxin-antitoxin system mRNA interferase toxin, RelE/StbE family [Patescibacteria group bacterium]